MQPLEYIGYQVQISALSILLYEKTVEATVALIPFKNKYNVNMQF